MAKIVIAGCANCPYYAKVELLADLLARSLPNFLYRTIVKYESEWENYLTSICQQNNWDHKGSPIIWSEPTGFGGPRFYLGDANSFQEYAIRYYDIRIDIDSCTLYKIAMENQKTKEEMDSVSSKVTIDGKKMKVCVLNANTSLFYCLLLALTDGSIFGQCSITLHLYESSERINSKLTSMVKEVKETALPYIEDIQIVTTEKAAIANADFVLIFDTFKPTPEENNDMWQMRVINSYKSLGVLLQLNSAKDARICLVNFDSTITGSKTRASFNSTLGANIIAQELNKIKIKNFILINGLIPEHARTVLSEHLHINPSSIKNLIVWGLPMTKKTFVIDTEHCMLKNSALQAVSGPGQSDFSGPLSSFLPQDDWLLNVFPEQVDKRQAVEEGVTGYQINLAMSDAIANQLRLWLDGGGADFVYTACVLSDGSYGLPRNIFLYLPVKFDSRGTFTIASGLHVSLPMLRQIKKALQVFELEFSDPFKMAVGALPSQYSTALRVVSDANVEDSLYATLEENMREATSMYKTNSDTFPLFTTIPSNTELSLAEETGPRSNKKWLASPSSSVNSLYQATGA